MDKFWVSETSPWIGYNLDCWEPLIGGLKPVLYGKKSFLFHQDDAAAFAYIIKSGRVRISCFSPAGTKKQLFIAESGCLCGEIPCIMGLAHTASAMAIVDTLAYRVTEPELAQSIRSNWEICKNIFNTSFRKNMVYRNQILELSFSQTLERTARLLLNLCKQYGTSLADGACRIELRFTHDEVASMVNSSRVTVNQIFSWLSEHGYIRRQAHLFVVLSPDRLEALAGGQRPRKL